jgi:hypothetical protein
VAVILIRIERQQSDEKDCYNNDKRGAHIFRLQLNRRQAHWPQRPLLKNWRCSLSRLLCQ